MFHTKQFFADRFLIDFFPRYDYKILVVLFSKNFLSCNILHALLDLILHQKKNVKLSNTFRSIILNIPYDMRLLNSAIQPVLHQIVVT